MRDQVDIWSGNLARNTFLYSPHDLPPYVLREREAARPGATATQIEDLEDRLGMDLPPSFRSFLSHANGSYGVRELETGGPTEDPPRTLLSAKAIDWTSHFDPDFISMFVENDFSEHGQSIFDDPGGHGVSSIVLEPDYLLGQDRKTRGELKHGQLLYGLTIGEVHGGQVVLNPLVADAAGEWELIELHYDTVERFSSFAQWFATIYEEVATEWTKSIPDLVARLVGPSSSEPEKREALTRLAGHAMDSVDARRELTRIVELGQLDGRLGTSASDFLERLDDRSARPETAPPRGRQITADDVSDQPLWIQQWTEHDDLTRLAISDLRSADAGRELQVAIEAIVATINGNDRRPIYELMKFDEPIGWRALDGLAEKHPAIAAPSLMAAACTSSPLLTERSANLFGDDSGMGFWARLALEIQRTQAAGDALLQLSNNGDRRALQALARRRDERVTDECISLAQGNSPDDAMIGVLALRDLRHPDSVRPLLRLAETSADSRTRTIATHALAMMQIAEASTLFLDLIEQPEVTAFHQVLLRHWVDQLVGLNFLDA